MDVVQAAITAIKRNDNLADMLKDCVAFTGDVDTAAAIAMGISSMSEYHDKNLPEHLYYKLGAERMGYHIAKLDEKLLSKFGR